MTRFVDATSSACLLGVVRSVWLRAAVASRAIRCALLLPALAVLLLPLSAQAKVPPGTGIAASETAAAHLTSTSIWTVEKSADPTSRMVDVGDSATVHWKITTTKSVSGTIGAYLDGQICVTNTGSRATQGLAIEDQVTEPPSTAVVKTAAVDVSAKPALNPGEARCYPYTIAVPAASIVPGGVYKDTSHVTITNQSCCPGGATGPSPSASAVLPTTATPIDSSITVTDTNGQTLTFSGGGSQDYDQSFDCTAIGTNTLDNTATIQSTGQTASAEATVGCHVYPQSNVLAQPICHELNSFGTCVSFFLDTEKAQSCDTPCVAEGKDHHQGLARTQELSDGSIYWFLSHSEVSEDEDRGRLMQFRYGGPVDNEHVTGDGVTAVKEEILALDDEKHPSDIDFLPDIDNSDSGYVFVAKEFGLAADCEDCTPQDQSTCDTCQSGKVTVYYWEPGKDFQPIGDITTALTKPSHILIDKDVDGVYYLIILDNTFGVGQLYRAYFTDLFPTSDKGSLNIAAFESQRTFAFSGDLGSQAQLVRDSTGAWFVLAYNSTSDDGNGDDFIHWRPIDFQAAAPLGDELGFVHIFLPGGETSFTNTGTHYVNGNGRLIISSSERWSHDRGAPFDYETRVDECVPGDYVPPGCAGQVCGPGVNQCGEEVESCGTCPASRPKCCEVACVCETCECP